MASQSQINTENKREMSGKLSGNTVSIVILSIYYLCFSGVFWVIHDFDNGVVEPLLCELPEWDGLTHSNPHHLFGIARLIAFHRQCNLINKSEWTIDVV